MTGGVHGMMTGRFRMIAGGAGDDNRFAIAHPEGVFYE